MRIARFITLALLIGTVTSAYADFINGSVFLFPIDSSMQFKSYGRADYRNTLNQRIDAPIAGEHSVSGAQVFTTSFSESSGSYSDFLEGPAESGACYSTRLEAWAFGEFGGHIDAASWDGPETKCAPRASGPVGDPPPVEVCDHCDGGSISSEPLILDLNGDGIWTTSNHDDPVWFDLNGNGLAERTAWTHPDHEDGFLYVDWNGNRQIDGGTELFGDATRMPDGTKASHGYEALSAYDKKGYGGDDDGEITPHDRIWSKLRVWVDRNHDGLMTRSENSTLAEAGVLSISLDTEVYGPERHYGADENGNLHFLRGSYASRNAGTVERRALHEVWFIAELK